MLIFFISTAVVTLLIDWAQTRYIAKNPERYFEINMILGKHPSVGAVNAYFSVCVVATCAAAYLLPNPWGAAWCGALAIFEVFVVARNYRFGVRFA